MPPEVVHEGNSGNHQEQAANYKNNSEDEFGFAPQKGENKADQSKCPKYNVHDETSQSTNSNSLLHPFDSSISVKKDSF